MLVRLLYASHASKPHCAESMESILTESRKHNPEHGITGVLCFSGDIFLQVLEGGRREVSALYHRIARDPRHCDIELLYFEEISERLFSSWTMGQVNLSKVNPSTLLKYAEKPGLDPFAIGGRMSLALLEELIATAAVVGKCG
ncbi:BLUF domain-containing protein [Chitinimonas arctica]|uniref:BLUF domain-containing protein n=1 Tax=Chitinimonas arctica TaxID=2594795 RepID=A0A516SK43_9NEIS|nr:BLUF domain-containing protein [Chitinimonas arctica]QDQ28532.1 BLUF domain-containing protein [Chitinimonas arctica]